MKGPLTEESILHLGKAQTLSTVSSIDLSGCQLCYESIDVSLFNKLTTLQSLDLSQNCLTHLPDELRLPTLRVLDISENQLETLGFIRYLSENLQELYVDGNPQITEEDYFIAKVICPSLKSTDSFADIKQIQTGIDLYTDQLRPQIQAVWEARFSEMYSNGIPDGELTQLHGEFVDTINKTGVVGSNISMPKFKAFMIDFLCQELIAEIRKGNFNSRRLPNSAENFGTPHYRTRVSSGKTAVKDYSSGIPLDTPSKKSTRSKTKNKVKSSLKKASDDLSIESSGKSLSAKKLKVSAVTQEEFTELNNEDDIPLARLPCSIDYEPFLFIRCHSRDNDPADSQTKVWRCAFEPIIGSPGETSNILATCGGRIVCIIDCQTGKVMKRYKDNSESESLYALAWTTLKAEGKNLKEDVNILAVAGDDRLIKLIHPTQLTMFVSLRGHKNYISSLVFHPSHPQRLFSGSQDNIIIMWDIGTPDLKDYSIKWSQLAVLQLPQTDAITMVINPFFNVLVAGCMESCFAWKLDHIKLKDKNLLVKPHVEVVHPRENDEFRITLDGLALLPNNCIVSKCVGHRHLYVWNLKEHIPDLKLKSRISQILLRPLLHLEYPDVDVDFIYPSTCAGTLCVGDNKGNVLMYELAEVINKKKYHDQPIPPSQVLQYPEIIIAGQFSDKMLDSTKSRNVVVNCVAQSSSKEYVVCGTDSNLVCLWKQPTKSKYSN